jgi:hypothetical protein
MSNNLTAYGIFRDRNHVEAGLIQIRDAGFRPQDVSLLFPENLGNKDLGVENSTKSAEGAAAGGAAGALAGGVLGWLAGIGLLAIPGVGPFVAAGPILAALAGMGAGATIGGISGALIGLGIPEYEAKRYEGRMKNGGILVSLHCDDNEWEKRAKEVLEAAGAEDIYSAGAVTPEYKVTGTPITLL